MNKINPMECLTSDMVAQDRKERRSNFTRGFNECLKQGPKLKPIDDLKFPDLFDGIYLGAILTGFQLIIVLFFSFIYFFVFMVDAFASYLIACLFVSNIFIMVFLKHVKILKLSVWKEITLKKGGV